MSFTKIAACSAVVMSLLAAPSTWAAPAKDKAATAKAAEAGPTAQELNDKLAAAKKEAGDAATARIEAVNGKIPDPAQPADEYKGDRSKRKYVVLTEQQQIARFEDAATKYASAIATVEEVQTANKKATPPTIPESSVEEALKAFKGQLARTLVADVKFRMDKKLGDVASWQKQVTDALKADPTNADAKKLDQELKDMAKKAADAKSSTAKPAAATGPLGDLSVYKKITEDTQALVQKGDLVAAKARIKDLETAWDRAEKTLKPMNPEKWTSVDQSIDAALAQLRSGAPKAAACSASLQALMAKLDALDKRS